MNKKQIRDLYEKTTGETHRENPSKDFPDIEPINPFLLFYAIFVGVTITGLLVALFLKIVEAFMRIL